MGCPCRDDLSGSGVLMEYRQLTEKSPTSILVVKMQTRLLHVFPGTKRQKLLEKTSSSVLMPQIMKSSARLQTT
jgi:hypothetical protein